MADDALLKEIRMMAAADHAYRLPLEANPYLTRDPRFDAWAKGWTDEDDRAHRLDEEIVKLPQFRVRAEIVAGGDVLASLERAELDRYTVSNLRVADDRAVLYESAEARQRFADRGDVRIRVTYEGEGRMFD